MSFLKTFLNRILRRTKNVDNSYVTLSDYSNTINFTQLDVSGFMHDFSITSKIKPEFWSTFVDRDAVKANSISFNQRTVGTNGSSVTGGMYSTAIINVSSAEDIGENPSDYSVPEWLKEETLDTTVDEKQTLSPVEVFHELERVPNTFSLLDVEKKLRLYQSMIELVRHDTRRGVTSTLKDATQRLQARLKYKKLKKVRAFFDQFQSTTDDAINQLLEKHTHMCIGPADDFIPEMPLDALSVMTKYAAETVAVAGSKPCFFLIAKKTDFKTKKTHAEKRDPILLVQSPFAYTWDILGAWGVEDMKLLNEL